MNIANKGEGDPEGRKLARRHAQACEEACRMAEVLAIMLRRAAIDDSGVNVLALKLREQCVRCMEKAEGGPVIARLTTKNTGHPLLEGRPANVLHLDESGTAVVGPEPVFALGGVAMHEEDCDAYVTNANALKMRFWGHTNITFHEPHMRKHRAIFNFHGDRAKQSAFEKDLRYLLKNTPFVCFGVAVRKDLFKSMFVDQGIDPYLPTKVYDLAIMLLLERYVDYLSTNADRRLGRVHLESIGKRDDAEHQAAYADLLLHGTQFVPESTFQSWVEAGCRFAPKQGSGPAELADLVAREVYEWANSDCKVDPRHWDILKPKIYRRDEGHFGRFGIKIFPADGLEDAIYAHRVACGAVVRN
jgi:hypothetical protein